MSALLWGLLGVAVAAAWLGAGGFARLRTPQDRLHAAGFIVVAVGAPIVVAAFVDDGPSTRSWKALLTLAALLVGGAASAHAIGRALKLRGSLPDARLEG